MCDRGRLNHQDAESTKRWHRGRGRGGKRERKPKVKNDPKLAAASRELRDWYLEQVNAGRGMIGSQGKYTVARALPTPQSAQISTTLLPGPTQQAA